ncbi:hypothetical protein GCM10023191_020780 [Actinoallomurus oryzae]|uniref:Uncharacterized protein n=1 Tax=Actinoallomurus oryzae TaxID=502180 RepID=A0ABP8PQ03_9ACTN
MWVTPTFQADDAILGKERPLTNNRTANGDSAPVRAELPPSTVRMRVAHLSIRTEGAGPWAGQQVGQCDADGDSAHPVLARETRDRGALAMERRPHFLELVAGECGCPAPGAPVRSVGKSPRQLVPRSDRPEGCFRTETGLTLQPP